MKVLYLTLIVTSVVLLIFGFVYYRSQKTPSEPRMTLGEALRKGATIIDVRSAEEFAGGHVKSAINIPLPEIESKAKALADRKTLVVVCCASGNRSRKASTILTSYGVSAVDGGSWRNVQDTLDKK